MDRQNEALSRFSDQIKGLLTNVDLFRQHVCAFLDQDERDIPNETLVQIPCTIEPLPVRTFDAALGAAALVVASDYFGIRLAIPETDDGQRGADLGDLVAVALKTAAVCLAGIEANLDSVVTRL
ncbi:hypothetical protein [Methylococcus sp. EFPC2]|uniref:hypothetical protein n=1 Tax=Methylococcus sp. EFPC2 TaxID=2812648 RepID=UPI00196701C5|nr:hypothetical protein [Methylococcus sp. EFPC2]QSA97119.1 hypothetical protein JWZ97_18320 [Methylococcus sp. EFPC2]